MQNCGIGLWQMAKIKVVRDIAPYIVTIPKLRLRLPPVACAK